MSAPRLREMALQSAALTHAQRDVVLAEELRLLVGAGAGSGKTSTVVQKLCYLLGAPVHDVDGHVYVHPSPLTLPDIAAITFTNASAADLKRKLRAALSRSGLRQLASDVDSARIGTIHGFCGDLLREFALRAGLPPMLRVLSEGESAVIAQDCAIAAVQDAAERMARNDSEGSAFAALLRDRALRDVVALVEEVAADTDRLATWSVAQPELRSHERALLALAQEALALRRTELERQSAMDFDRMIVAVRDLLRSDANVRHAVQRQLRLLIIDEFQDVDPAQRDLAYLLGGLECEDPSPTRIMLVGDPKQSIYKFRRADVSLWNAVRHRLASDAQGRALELSDNFRSRRGILSLVDAVIGSRLDEPVSAERGRQQFEVDYRPLQAAGSDKDGDRCVEIIGIAPAEPALTLPAMRAIEARTVAARMVALNGDGESWGDMAMLLASFSDVSLYLEALRAAGIPVYVLRGEGFYEAREVLDCLVALRVIRDTGDEVAVMGFLRSPFVGVRDDTLMALREARHARGIFGAMRHEPRERALLDRAVALIYRFEALRDRIPVHTLLQRLITESGFLAALSLDTDRGVQAVGNVRKLLRIASATPELSLGEFLRDIHEARARQDRVGEERVYRERADVVTITTVHSAKGLEWPIVFWCDLLREGKTNTDALQCGRELFRLKCDTGEFTGKDEPLDSLHAALCADLREEQRAETFRMWYVAATRARRLLVLSGVPLGAVKKAAPNMATLLRERFPALCDAAPHPETIAYAAADGAPFALVLTAARTEAHPGHAGTVDDARGQPLSATPALPLTPQRTRAGRTRLSATQLMTFDSDPATWYRRYIFGFEPPASRIRHSGSSSAAQGSAVHDVLEHLNYEASDVAELVDAAIERHDPQAASLGTAQRSLYRQRITEMVERAVHHPQWQALIRTPGVRRELAFTCILADGSVIEGLLDLAAPLDNGIRVLDAKTGRAGTDEMFAARYRVQGAVYAGAVRAIMASTGTATDVTFGLLDTTSARVVDVDVRETNIPALVASLRAHHSPTD